MGKKSSKAPDTKGAANIEGEFARETARDQTYADRPDQINPFGSVKWGQDVYTDPATGEKVTKWSQNQQLSDPLQKMFDSTTGMMGGRADLASGLNDRVAQEMGGAPDWAQFGDVAGFDPAQQRQMAEDSAYQKSASRLDPRFESQQESTELKLRQQGLRPGDQAYDSAMKSFGNERTDAYEQARLGSVAEGRDEYGVALQGNERANQLRQQQIDEYLNKRGFSLGEQDKLTQGQTLSDLSGIVSGGGSA